LVARRKAGIYPTDTLVTCTATDAAGNASQATFNVQVQDTVAPALQNIPADPTIVEGNAANSYNGNIAPGPAYTEPTATDVVDASPTVVCDVLPTATYPYSPPDPTDTLVTCTATDGTGNASQATFNVQVQDTTPPTITVNDIIFGACAIPVPQNLITLGATASDIVDPSPALTDNAPTEFPIGETIVTWAAEDASGNDITGVLQKVTVAAKDPDKDGITECIDTLTAQFSDDFDDSISEGGQTDGGIDTRFSSGDQDLLIFDVIDPDGILAFAENTGGPTPAKIIVCDAKGELELDAGRER